MRGLFVRRSATAVGIYVSVALGFLATIVATRELHVSGFGDYATVLFAVGLLQGFFDVTVEEAVVKYGFRYVTREDWPRLSRLLRSAVSLKLVGGALGAVGLLVFAAVGPSRLAEPLAVGSLIPLVQSLDGLAGTLLFLRSRYDIRSFFLSWSMLLRLAGVAVGAHFGVTQAILGILVAQTIGTASVAVAGIAAFRRFPSAAPQPLGDDRGDIRSFMVQSTVASGVTSLRTGLGPLLLGAVTSTVQVGLFRVAQAPQSAFIAVSAPARMVLLTEQTREWERGNQRAVLRGIRNYSLLAAAASVVLAPPLYVFIPQLIRHINGPGYVGAAGAARLFILAAVVQFVVGWTKSLPVTIGRPELRLRTQTLESVVALPLIAVFGAMWGASGAAAAVLVSIVVFAAVWIVLVLRIEPVDEPSPSAFDEELVAEGAEAGALSP
ncbi:MAG TPA: lipopolysaccharide biosynthesis protein [Gaiellaceae bacterium]|jgi:O-antigen/teichoic acid export membrane protein